MVGFLPGRSLLYTLFYLIYFYKFLIYLQSFRRGIGLWKRPFLKQRVSKVLHSSIIKYAQILHRDCEWFVLWDFGFKYMIITFDQISRDHCGDARLRYAPTRKSVEYLLSKKWRHNLAGIQSAVTGGRRGNKRSTARPNTPPASQQGNQPCANNVKWGLQGKNTTIWEKLFYLMFAIG